MHNYKQLKVWEKAMELVVAIYEAAVDFPKTETYGLTSQIRRSAVSIASNIAEGAGRNSDKEFCHFLAVAHGSSYELETQIIASERLKLITAESSNALCEKINEIQRMNYTLQTKLNPNLIVNNKAHEASKY